MILPNLSNRIKIISAAVLATALLGSCTRDFVEINKDPNRLESVTPGTLLNPTIYNAASYGMSRSRSFTFELMQVAGAYPSESVEDQAYLYDFREDIGNGIWDTYYKCLANTREMELSAIKLGNNNYLAISLTLKALFYSILTDCFGDIPMSTALNGEQGNFFPAFDKQEQVYTTILADLEKANTLYGTGLNTMYAADILFNNDLTKWRKFTNSLRLRLLLRTLKKMPGNAAIMAGMLQDATKYPIFQSNADAAVLSITGVTPNISPWSRPQDYSTGRVFFDFFTSNLNNFKDPRAALFAGQAKDKNNKNIGIKGLPVTFIESPASVDFSPSGLLQRLVIAPMIAPILSYAEVELIQAELAQRNIIAATTAEEHYKKGVEAAITMWGGVMPTTYFNLESTKYDGTLERIMLQKYYALFFTDYQQWFEQRRTGFPVLPTTTFMYNDRKMPSRLYYPTTLKVYNTDNYLKVVEQMGGDKINVKVWWEQ
ncbi:SusD/RagB family nutrient-binding outer membrane lipoprotein [Chitinophaga qingshengii]|uniref:SusD/RagB family nutrient-binding outer membrane lipoprotein n=1 Tax=Chitinophaga qingshengii TaxID=1569794 RepID=A0ABR7TSZ2_9BACT|nr:SusD/RagB family nutrient-binding outer membrane lipoprotein [Chitinophaga qingshengii]MBC9933586.1 SusD/RagB family nutrient-binding outer membrane lipoprotein [Chitinophaga qingshengii]